MADLITTNRIKERLESVYGIPFNVVTEHASTGVSLRVSLASGFNDYFTLVFFASNRIRLKISLEPDAYSQPLFQSMAAADAASKVLFMKYANALTQESRNASFTVNDVDLFTLDIAEWPTQWSSAKLEVEIFPIPECNTESDLLTFLLPWVEEVAGLLFSLIDISEDVSGEGEGSKFSVTQTKYERSTKNRAACLAHYGYCCKICGMNFEEKYGSIGANFIHVHHIVPVSQIGENYIMDPIKDLIPVCPNCHAMLHKKNPPLFPSELYELISHDTHLHEESSSMIFLETNSATCDISGTTTEFPNCL
ncbi:MAG: HNH endonuclease [Raoultibacter sp.]